MAFPDPKDAPSVNQKPAPPKLVAGLVPGQPIPPDHPLHPANLKKSDGQTDAYERVVNGKVVKVNAYGSKPSTSTAAATAVRLLPGRPRMAGKPGTYSSGRDLPGIAAAPPAPAPMPPEMMGQPPHGKQPFKPGFPLSKG